MAYILTVDFVSVNGAVSYEKRWYEPTAYIIGGAKSGQKLFGTRINKARKDRGLTAEKLAEACNINSTYLRQIEGGKKLPSLPVFATLCRELRVSPNYILPDLVEGTEAEKIQKIFSESDPTPSQIEMLAEMAGVILKER